MGKCLNNNMDNTFDFLQHTYNYNIFESIIFWIMMNVLYYKIVPHSYVSWHLKEKGRSHRDPNLFKISPFKMSEEQALVIVETVKALLDGAEQELEEEAVSVLLEAIFPN